MVSRRIRKLPPACLEWLLLWRRAADFKWAHLARHTQKQSRCKSASNCLSECVELPIPCPQAVTWSLTSNPPEPGERRYQVKS